jgi:nicotinate-nucleotide adenylyltransferase
MAHSERIGVFGGTFDPIHKAHVAMAKAAREAAGLDRVLFVVSARPPHKNRQGPCADAEERYAMVEAALCEEPGLEASRIELDRPGASYTADTLEALRSAYPTAQLFLIVGLDSLVDLPKWHKPAEILDLAQLLVLPRPGEYDIPKSIEGHYRMIPFEETGISSTEVRQALTTGERVAGLIPPAVVNYIRSRGLYEDCA